MFEILESHSKQTLIEVEDENSHLQILQLIQFHFKKKKNSVDNIYYFGPNLKSQKEKNIACHNTQIWTRSNFSFLFFITACCCYRCILIFFRHIQGLVGNDRCYFI